MSQLYSTILHVVLAMSVLAAVCVLAAIGTISGNDAFTVIVGVAVGGGVLAGANIGNNTSTPPLPTPPAPPQMQQP